MKFMVKWKIHEDKRQEVMDMFAKMDLEEYKTHHGPEINLVGRWHDIVRLQGWMVFETDNQEALNLWLTTWIAVCDFQIAPVVEDDEAHETVRKFLSKK
jgi:hypothetical protein